MTSIDDQSPPAGSEGIGTEPAEGSTTEVPRARLTRLKINRFRNVKPGTELRFDDGINVLLGRNGTGKTTLLELIRGLASGDLLWHQRESFDLEFDLHVGDYRFVTSTQNTAPSLAYPIQREHSTSWKYHVDFYGPFGFIGSTDATPRTGRVTLGGEPGMERISEDSSLFDPMFYTTPFLVHMADRVRPLIDNLLSVHNNCLRLDEGLDVFRSIVDGTIIPNVYFPLLMRLSSEVSADLAWYVPRQLMSYLQERKASLHDATEVVIDQEEFDVLDAVARSIGVQSVRCALALVGRKTEPTEGTIVSTFGKPTFWITTHRGTTFTHDKLSYGEKRLLIFMYHAACNPQVLVADELVNGLHHGWIQACLDAIQGQAFLTSQNPLLLDHLPFASAEEVQRRFVLCDRDEHGDWIWRNMEEDAAGAFYRAYKVGIQHVSEILETKGLW